MYDTKKIDVIKRWLGSGSINIFGRPFAGKDAQGKRLVKLFGGNLVGGGEILRSNEIPKHANEYIKTGRLLPSNDFVDIVLPYLSQSRLANKPLFLSSLGRWHGEEDDVIATIEKSGHPIKAVIYLDISTTESHARWLAREINNDRQDRYDDTEATLNIRFDEFSGKTLPVIGYYRNLGLLVEIDGSGSRDEVTNLIIDALYEQATD